MAKAKVDDNILSIDLGYSGVKYYFKRKGKVVSGKIPTAVKKIDDEDIYDEEVFEYNGSKYLIGEEAIDQDVNISLKAGTLIKNAPLLVYVVLKINNIEHKGLSLITGLSLKDFDDKGDELIEILKDFTVNDEEIKLDVSLLPQGRGIAYDYFSKNPQEDLALILDVGYNTLDFITMKKDKLSIRNSFANTNGINIILNKLQYELNSQFDIKRTTTELNETISANNKTLKHRGEIIDFSDALKGITEDYIDSIKQDIVEKDNILERADILLIGGGGAYILRAISDDGLQKMFNFKNIVFVDDPYEFSNARGYYVRELSLKENNAELNENRMERPVKDDIVKKKPMSFTIDKSSLILWKLLDYSRSNFVAAMLQYAVKDEKLRDIFYGKNGINALKAFKLIEEQEERRWQEFLSE